MGRFGAASSVLVLLAFATPARAEPGVCDLDPAGARVCLGPRGCTERVDCLVGGRADAFVCESLGPIGTSGTCVPDCTTMFSCNVPTDCPTLGLVVPTCDPVEPPVGMTSVPSACTYRTGTTSLPPNARITYCTAPAFHIPSAMFRACHTDPSGVVTDDYFRGDCDADGCPNGADTDPCTAARGACTATNTFDSPLCVPPPALACDVTASGLVCDEARPCRTDATALACGIGACEDGWSDVPRCRPACSTLFLCRTGTLPGGGTPPEQCPPLDGADGVCAPLPGSIAPVRGRDGLCLYTDFFDTSCTATTVGSACFATPAGGTTSNYFAGDCDSDGAPNACDTLRCVAGGGTSACVAVPGTDCTPSFTPMPDAGPPPSDAGLDAATSDAGTGDAGANDGGNVVTDGSASIDAAAPDAGSSIDAGGAALDAGTGSGPTSSFAGGGGCRCAAAGGGRGSRLLAAFVLLGLAVSIRARRG